AGSGGTTTGGGAGGLGCGVTLPPGGWRPLPPFVGGGGGGTTRAALRPGPRGAGPAAPAASGFRGAVGGAARAAGLGALMWGGTSGCCSVRCDTPIFVKTKKPMPPARSAARMLDTTTTPRDDDWARGPAVNGALVALGPCCGGPYPPDCASEGGGFEREWGVRA